MNSESVSNCADHENRIQELEKLISEIHEALLGSDRWDRPGLVKEFHSMRREVRGLSETKNRALWLLLAVGGIGGAIGAFIKTLFVFWKQ
jgi:hypothetical protein